MAQLPDDLGFDDWLRYVFDHPVTSTQWYFDIDADFWEAPSVIVVDYLTRLFSDPLRCCRGYTDKQLNQGLWFLISTCGCNDAAALMDDAVPWPVRRQGIDAIVILFERLFAERCSDRLSHLDERGVRPLNSVCYMWWDLFPTLGPLSKQSRDPVDDATFDVMRTILDINSQACQESALHGLGHYQHDHPTRVRRTIDDFLARHPKLRRPLRDYACAARQGAVL